MKYFSAFFRESLTIRFGFIYINDLSHLIDLPNDEDNRLSFNRQKGLILIHKPILVQKVLFLKALSCLLQNISTGNCRE
ncbi:hypothetical protein RM69_00810 [Mesotoga sp. SC_NapDC3]|nr:hypothetical protein RM69_00810 [Mesotoga sp. SC_NapDC3]PXF35507.1 hypothetical protein EU77_01085 [Mesotoga sp. SC_NapDC]